MRSILVSLITLLQLFTATASAEQKPGFDGSAGTRVEVFLSNLPEMRAPIPNVPLEIRHTAVVADEYGRPFLSYEEARLLPYAKAREEQYKAAGYIITESRIIRNKDYIEYHFGYRPPEGYHFSETEQYRIVKDSNNNFYNGVSELTLSIAGAEMEKRIQAGGYKIAYTYFSKNRWGTGTYDYNLEYVISYMAPVNHTTRPVSSYTLARNSKYELYTNAAWFEVKDPGLLIEERLKAAGFIVLNGRVEAVYLGQGKHDYNLQYYISYLSPVTDSPAAIQTYKLSRDAQNKPYPLNNNYELTQDGKAMENRLKAAGNVVIYSWIWATNLGQGPTDRSLEYVIEYAPAPGGSQNDILKYELSKGQDGRPYTGYQGKRQAEADGKVMAANFAAAGYVVLESRLVQYGNEDRWGYLISYTLPMAR